MMGDKGVEGLAGDPGLQGPKVHQNPLSHLTELLVPCCSGCRGTERI